MTNKGKIVGIFWGSNFTIISFLMTIAEFKNKVIESPDSDWHNNRVIDLNYSHINYKETLNGITAVYEFLCQQIEGFEFESLDNNLPDEIKTVIDIFKRCKTKIIDILRSDQRPEGDWNTNVKAQLEANNIPKFLYNSPYSEFLIKLFNEQPNYYKGAYDFITQGHLYNIHKNTFIGYLLSYEFLSKGFSEIANRKNIEEKSNANTKRDFQVYLSESEAHLSRNLSTSNQKVIDASAKIDDLLKEKSENYNKWHEESYKNFESYFNTSKDKIDQLQDLYQQKLKLEAPAKYWNDRSKALRKEGNSWLVALICCLLVAVVILIWILAKISDGSIIKIFSNTGTAIKWSVVLITLISFLAYAVRTFSKLAFSSFHLYRDAQEREQLTYVYLALQKEKGVDQTERHLIMQSLFSRADSGLLKDDASPTMPGNIVDKFIDNK